MRKHDAVPEWTYTRDELGVVYCLGRDSGGDTVDAVATYYETSPDLATKQAIDSDTYYRRFIYQGLPEERDRLAQVERPEVVNRLLSHAGMNGVGLITPKDAFSPSNPRYSNISEWLGNTHPRTTRFRTALAIAGTALSRADVQIEDLALYGGAAFGVVNTAPKNVDDVDFVFTMQQREGLNHALEVLKSDYTCDDIDPFGRLPKERQLLKAKRWSTSQVRLLDPYPFSIDFKVRRTTGEASLWDRLPEHAETAPFSGPLKVVDDSEALCISPALVCEDPMGNERVVLFDGYQYIGGAVAGDEIAVSGSGYRDSNVVRVSQSDRHGMVPDFRNVPIA